MLKWKKYTVLNDGFICLVDVMGDDAAIVQAARCSYGKDERLSPNDHYEAMADSMQQTKDRALIRRLMLDGHTSPFEMVEFKFLVRVPMDCWRQWVRHRTANINEYSTRYKEAINSQQTTDPDQWRSQAKDNKQGSSGYITEWSVDPNEFGCYDSDEDLIVMTPGEYLTEAEQTLQLFARQTYSDRLALGVAREQARKDLPLSTYTEAYWKCDLHNIFNFLRLRMDSHAQLEIRLYANAMFHIIQQVCPIACEAFEDYVLNVKKFSHEEMKLIKDFYVTELTSHGILVKPSTMTDNEWSSFLAKLS